MSSGRYLLGRVLLVIPILLGVSIVTFTAVRLLPGDPALALAGENATKDYVEQVRHDMLLDQPLYAQYGAYLGSLLQGTLGRSTRSRSPVTSEIAARYPATLELAAASVVVATVLGVALGIAAAVRSNTVVDLAAMLTALLGLSMPIFWLGLLLILVFAVGLHWLPAGGAGGLDHLILPALAQGAVGAGLVARMTRSALLDTLHAGFVRTARAKGLREWAVVLKHALPNALVPILTVVGLQAGYLLGGTVLTESVFAWPGMGKLVVDSILTRDYPMVQGTILVFAVSFALVNLLVDVLYVAVDPRVRYS